MLKWFLIFCGVVVTLGCASSKPSMREATVIEDVDFNYDTVWGITTAAMNRYFEDFEQCDKGNPLIVTGLQERYEEGSETGVEYADQGRVYIEQRGARYFIHIRVDRYERPKRVYTFEYEGWRWLCRNLDMEVKVKKQFEEQIKEEQRLWQGRERFKEKMGQ
ncbi:MAG: hypothetical protein N2234_03810 [Planctomycetota bacterium]|nr:hypothetical protein [Planctomycetota bacterium]